MGVFDTTEKKGYIIKNEEALNYEYVPKLLPYREGQVKEIANSIKPMLTGSRGQNLFITGAPGIGKTASVRWVLRELSDTTDDIMPLYVNCWNYRTKYFVLTELANQLKLSFTAGKGSEHLLQQIRFKLKDKAAVFAFDEIDKIEDTEFLYQILSLFPKSNIILISNADNYLAKLEPRIRSRLMAKGIEFKQYKLSELEGIIKERAKFALRSSALSKPHLGQIANITFNKKDVRIGLFLLKEAAKSAEIDGRSKIQEEDIQKVLKTIDSPKINDEEKLNADETKILECVKEKNGAIAGELYEAYSKKGGTLSYRSFKRYLTQLSKLDLVKLERTAGGFKGKSTRIFII